LVHWRTEESHYAGLVHRHVPFDAEEQLLRASESSLHMRPYLKPLQPSANLSVAEKQSTYDVQCWNQQYVSPDFGLNFLLAPDHRMLLHV